MPSWKKVERAQNPKHIVPDTPTDSEEVENPVTGCLSAENDLLCFGSWTVVRILEKVVAATWIGALVSSPSQSQCSRCTDVVTPAMVPFVAARWRPARHPSRARFFPLVLLLLVLLLSGTFRQAGPVLGRNSFCLRGSWAAGSSVIHRIQPRGEFASSRSEIAKNISMILAVCQWTSQRGP